MLFCTLDLFHVDQYSYIWLTNIVAKYFTEIPGMCATSALTEQNRTEI